MKTTLKERWSIVTKADKNEHTDDISPRVLLRSPESIVIITKSWLKCKLSGQSEQGVPEVLPEYRDPGIVGELRSKLMAGTSCVVSMNTGYYNNDGIINLQLNGTLIRSSTFSAGIEAAENLRIV